MTEVCVDARMALHSGIGTYIRNLLPHLKAGFPKLRVLATPSVIEKWPVLSTYDVILVQSPIYSIREQFELPCRIPEVDIFWSPHYNIPVMPILAKRRIVTIHDVYHLVYAHTLSMPKYLYAKMMLSRAVCQSDHIITVSQFSQGEIAKMTTTPLEKITVIYNGVDRDLFNPISPHKRENYFLFVGTQAPHKNLERLLEAWKVVVQKFPQRRLVIVGKQKQHPLTDDASVQFLGEVGSDLLPGIYARAFATIAPSIYEGFGLTPLESMAMRCPTIVSQIASFPEICGEASLYVNPLDSSDIARQMCRLITDDTLRESLIRKGIDRVDQFCWTKSAQQHIDLISQTSTSFKAR